MRKKRNFKPCDGDGFSGRPMSEDKTHVTWHEQHVPREQREALNQHAGCVVWFTGLSGCGKSTVANHVDQKLHRLGARSYVLDGDNLRHGLNAGPEILKPLGEAYAKRFGLGFAAEDRRENLRRVGAVAQLFADAGIITLAAFVSPYRVDRQSVREHVEGAGRSGDFIEVFVDAPLEVCESRDPKGLYKKARKGEITNFTGIDDPYEAPLTPELHLQSNTKAASLLADEVIDCLRQRGVLAKS